MNFLSFFPSKEAVFCLEGKLPLSKSTVKTFVRFQVRFHVALKIGPCQNDFFSKRLLLAKYYLKSWQLYIFMDLMEFMPIRDEFIRLLSGALQQ